MERELVHCNKEYNAQTAELKEMRHSLDKMRKKEGELIYIHSQDIKNRTEEWERLRKINQDEYNE